PGAEKSRICGMIGPAHFDVGIGARHAKALMAVAVDKNRLDDRRRLAHQAKHVDAVAVVEALAPGRLDGPVHLSGNAGEKLLNPRGRRGCLRTQALVQRMTLVEVTEPRFARAAREQRQGDRREQRRKVFLKQRSAKTGGRRRSRSPAHSITSSERSRTVSGISSPRS